MRAETWRGRAAQKSSAHGPNVGAGGPGLDIPGLYLLVSDIPGCRLKRKSHAHRAWLFLPALAWSAPRALPRTAALPIPYFPRISRVKPSIVSASM